MPLGLPNPPINSPMIYADSRKAHTVWVQFFNALVKLLTGTVTANVLATMPVQFVNLPASPVEGMLVSVTDSLTDTWGDAITAGGGGLHVLAYYGGSSRWTVAAKS